MVLARHRKILYHRLFIFWKLLSSSALDALSMSHAHAVAISTVGLKAFMTAPTNSFGLRSPP